MQELEVSGLLASALAERVASWLDAGKLDEDDLSEALTANARALVDTPSQSVDWMPLVDVESLVAVVSDQLGGGTGLVEWAETVVTDWSSEATLMEIVASGNSKIDGAGAVVALSSEQLIRDVDWRFEGGREQFSVRLLGLDGATADLKTVIGALLSRLAQGVAGGFDDLRFEGVDCDELCVFGLSSGPRTIDACGEARLHRAALIG